MAGFVLDIILEFIFRVVVQFFRSQRAKSWPVVEAKVSGASYRPGGFGCTVVRLTYQYRINGNMHTGISAEPFLWSSSAKDYIEQHSGGSKMPVRVKPGAPEVSIVREKDLYLYAHEYRLETK